MGNIYSDHKCECGGTFEHIENKGLFCRDCKKRLTRGFIVRFGTKTSKRFNDYKKAYIFLCGLRFESDKGVFDYRDWRADHPLGFHTQAEKYLNFKKEDVGPSQYGNIKRDIYKAISAWGQVNVKTIKYAEIEDFLMGLEVGPKTRANTKSVLSDFFTWLAKREGVPIPDMPECRFELGWRNIVDLKLQEKIIKEIRKISYDINPKIWLGVKWLATYVAFRPNELRNLKERHINVNGFFVVPHPKEKEPKLIPMLDEDITLYKSMPRGFPELYFFRHAKGNGSAKPGQQFGKDYLYKWWKKACVNLGVEGVDLYGGTRHSTTTALGEHFTKTELKDSGTFHKTNKSFERYMQNKKTESLKVYQKISEMKGKVVQYPYNISEDSKESN